MDDQEDVDLWYQNSVDSHVYHLARKVWSNRLLQCILVSLETVSFLILFSFLLRRILVRENSKKGATNAIEVVVVVDNGSGMFKGKSSVAAAFRQYGSMCHGHHVALIVTFPRCNLKVDTDQ
jgi:hypothetical protein